MDRVEDLLREAREAGLSLTRQGDLLQVEGPRSMAPLAKALIARKADVFARLARGGPGPEFQENPHETENVGPNPPPLSAPPDLLDRAKRLSASDLVGWLDGDDLLRRAAAEVEIHARVDLLLDEVEGRKAPPNPTVHAMFEEASRRFGRSQPGVEEGD